MITQAELLGALSRGGFLRGTWSIAKDSTYSPISVAYVREALEAWLDSLPPALVEVRSVGGSKTDRFARWVEDAGDCDNTSFDFLAYLNRAMWVDAVLHGKRGNVAAGAFYFFVWPGDTSSAHSIVWFVDYDGLVHHVDAGRKQIDHLTPAQLETIFGGEYA